MVAGGIFWVGGSGVARRRATGERSGRGGGSGAVIGEVSRVVGRRSTADRSIRAYSTSSPGCGSGPGAGPHTTTRTPEPVAGASPITPGRAERPGSADRRAPRPPRGGGGGSLGMIGPSRPTTTPTGTGPPEPAVNEAGGDTGAGQGTGPARRGAVVDRRPGRGAGPADAAVITGTGGRTGGRRYRRCGGGSSGSGLMGELKHTRWVTHIRTPRSVGCGGAARSGP